MNADITVVDLEICEGGFKHGTLTGANAKLQLGLPQLQINATCGVYSWLIVITGTCFYEVLRISKMLPYKDKGPQDLSLDHQYKVIRKRTSTALLKLKNV